MNKKIGIGIIDGFGEDALLQCESSLPKVDYVFKYKIQTYISYGSIYNIMLRYFYDKNVDYIFIIKSSTILADHTLLQDYINTAKNFGTWFMSRGRKNDPFSTIEDNSTNLNLHLFQNLYNDLFFTVKGIINNVGFFNEGYTNFANNDDLNCLELYEYFLKIEKKINYLPLGYFPDTEWSLTKSNINKLVKSSNKLYLQDTQDNLSKIYGKFYYLNKVAPGQHLTKSKEEAFSRLENIQKNYSQK